MAALEVGERETCHPHAAPHMEKSHWHSVAYALAKWHAGQMDDLLRFPGAVRRDPRIESWFSEFADPHRLTLTAWFERMRACGSDVRELLHDGCPVACLGDAPFGYVNAYKNHASVGFYYGAALSDPSGLLEGAGKRMRHVKLHPGKRLKPEALENLVLAAYEDIRRRLGLLKCLKPASAANV